MASTKKPSLTTWWACNVFIVDGNQKLHIYRDKINHKKISKPKLKIQSASRFIYCLVVGAFRKDKSTTPSTQKVSYKRFYVFDSFKRPRYMPDLLLCTIKNFIIYSEFWFSFIVVIRMWRWYAKAFFPLPEFHPALSDYQR